MSIDAEVSAFDDGDRIILDAHVAESGLVIGKKGATLDALQYVVNRIVFKRPNEGPLVVVDAEGYGLRVPALVISPWARHGYVDHQTLSFDAYLKFIEDDFLGGQRIDPATDGRPDSRTVVRENVKILGNLVRDFDFTQRPRTPELLPIHPAFS